MGKLIYMMETIQVLSQDPKVDLDNILKGFEQRSINLGDDKPPLFYAISK